MRPKLVRDLMSREVTTLERNDRLSLADSIMSLGRIRHMPVLDEEGKLVGLVSQRDLCRGALTRVLGFGTRARRQVLDSLLVEEVMAEDLHTTSPDAPIAEAAVTMSTHKIGCLPVVEDERLVGLLTEGDFVSYFARAGS